MSLRTHLFALALLSAPSTALAGDTVVLSPLMSKGVDAMVVMNVTSLMSSELDFMGDVDGVVELPKAPTSSSCLGSTSCLSGLAKEGGGTKVIAGTISKAGSEFLLDLVLYSKSAGRVERRKEFRLDSSPEAVADGMTAVLKELWTGKAPKAEAAEEISVASFTPPSASDDDDIAFEDDLSDWDPEEEARLEAERKRAEEEERRRREEEARRRAEEEERRRAEEEARRREEEERERRAREAQAAEPEPEFDPSAISFGDATGEITAEEINDAIQFGSSSSSPAPAPAPRPIPGPIDDPDEADRRARSQGGMEDLDGGTAKVDRDAASFTLAVRGGGAKYFGLNFVTAGAEVTVAMGGSGLYLLGGFETYAASRQVPPELQASYGRVQEWNFLYPINAGLLYRIDDGGRAVPYIGVDVVGASYFVDPPTIQPETGFELAGKRHNTVGARARLGADIMFTPAVGLNVNAAIGGWSGKRWPVIDSSAKAGGLLPQISAGALVAF
jgi:hypothetical protein